MKTSSTNELVKFCGSFTIFFYGFAMLGLRILFKVMLQNNGRVVVRLVQRILIYGCQTGRALTIRVNLKVYHSTVLTCSGVIKSKSCHQPLFDTDLMCSGSEGSSCIRRLM